MGIGVVETDRVGARYIHIYITRGGDTIPIHNIHPVGSRIHIIIPGLVGDIRVTIQGDHRTGRIHHMHGAGDGIAVRWVSVWLKLIV